MKPRDTSRSSNWKEFCQQLGEEDGIDPRLTDRRSSSSRRRSEDRKTHQLCQQVAQVLESMLTGEVRDADLEGLSVVSVVPAPHAGRMLVTVQSWADDAANRWLIIHEKLRRATPWLRSELAASISRKRTPELEFHLAGPTTPATWEHDDVASGDDSEEEAGHA